jgi:hypothetical protein
LRESLDEIQPDRGRERFQRNPQPQRAATRQARPASPAEEETEAESPEENGS